jgi:hypothetical protein
MLHHLPRTRHPQPIAEVIDCGDLAALNANQVTIDETHQFHSSGAAGRKHILRLHGRPII